MIAMPLGRPVSAPVTDVIGILLCDTSHRAEAQGKDKCISAIFEEPHGRYVAMLWTDVSTVFCVGPILLSCRPCQNVSSCIS